MKRKVVSMLLAAAMVCSLAACGNKNNDVSKESTSKSSEVKQESSASAKSSEAAEEETVTYPLDTDEKLTIAMMYYDFKTTPNSADITQTPFFEEYQKRTGVELEIVTYEAEDAYNLILAGDDLPDILMWAPILTSNDQQIVDDGIVSSLTADEISKWAPNLATVLEAYPNARKELTLSDGSVIGFPFLTGDDKMMATNGLIVRGDWLDQLGISAPTTPEEFLDMLRAFKKEMGAEYPMALTSHRMNLLFNYGFFSSPYGLITSGAYVKDGQYHLGWAEPEHKKVLEFFHTMYEEGLINPDYLTLDQASVDGMLYDGRTGVVQQSVIAGLGTYVPNMKKTNPDAELRGIGSLLGANGERAYYGATENAVGEFKGLISTGCKNKELAMRFLDWGYSEEGQLFLQFGVEGVSYEMKDGKPVYTDLIINNPDGLTSGQAMNQYSRGGCFWTYVSRLEYFEQVTAMPEQRGAVEAWDANDRYTYKVPAISVPQDLKDENSKISSDMNTYVSEMRAKFISGEESLDNFDAYLAKLKELGLERRLEIMQTALDEFNSR
mgnify:FL=1